MDKGSLLLRQSYDNIYNNDTFWTIYSQLEEYAINMFEWKGLPDTCDERFLELILYEFGYCLFFQKNSTATYGTQPSDEFGNGAFLNLQCTISGMLDIYRRPTRRRAYAVNGFNQECTDLDSVIIFNNYLRQPTFLMVEYFARRLYAIQRTLDVNLNAVKTPVLIRTSRQQELTMRNVYKKYTGNEPVIFGDKDIDLSGFEVLKTDAPYLVDKLQDAYDREMNRFFSWLGLNNANTMKKERLVTDEANANNEQILLSRDIMLNARKQACDMINDMFWAELDSEISVDFRHINSTTQQKEGEANVGVYNANQKLY